MPQDISLFHRSVMDNIRYGRPEASDADVLDAIVAANCEFIEDLPDVARPSLATAASSSPPDSDSASELRGRFSRTRQFCSWMRPLRHSTAMRRRPYGRHWIV